MSLEVATTIESDRGTLTVHGCYLPAEHGTGAAARWVLVAYDALDAEVALTGAERLDAIDTIEAAALTDAGEP